MFECSADGIFALTTFAHMSLVSRGFPDKIHFHQSGNTKSVRAEFRMRADGRWTAHTEDDASGLSLSPDCLVRSIAFAAHVPLDDATHKELLGACNPLADRDFAHFRKVLDLIPLHSLSSMMAHGPSLLRAFNLGVKNSPRSAAYNGRFYSDMEYHADIALFARCIASAIKRRKASVAGIDVDINTMIEEVSSAAGGARLTGMHNLRLYQPTCVEIAASHTPAQAIEDFLAEAVRAGFDINAVFDAGSSFPATAAHEAVRVMDVTRLKRLIHLGLDLNLADGVRSLADIPLAEIRRAGNAKQKMAMLKFLIDRRGFKVTQPTYTDLQDRIKDLRDRLRHGHKETADLYEVLVNAADFIEARFPELHREARTRRKAA